MTTRRTFMTGAVAAMTAPRLVFAQAMPRRRIAWTGSTPNSDRDLAFLGELGRLGYVEGENLIIERIEGDPQLVPATRDADTARRVLAAAPDLVYVDGGTQIAVALRGTSLPVVFFTPDPVLSGMVSNLARPGENMTGVSGDAGRQEVGKQMQFLVDASVARRIAWLGPAGTVWTRDEPFLRAAAEQLAVDFLPLPIAEGTSATYAQAFAAMGDHGTGAVMVRSGFRNSNLEEVAARCLEARLPCGGPANIAEAGGMVGLGPNVPAQARRAAQYVARVLQGVNPGDLPVLQPDEYRFIINLRTVRALGIAVPATVMAIATEFIE